MRITVAKIVHKITKKIILDLILTGEIYKRVRKGHAYNKNEGGGHITYA